MDDSKVFMFPEKGNSGIDATTALLLGNGGGFGNGFNNPFWMMFMWPLMYPFMNMFGGGWGNGFGGNNGGAGFLANQLNNDAGRELIVQAINGRADALGQLAQITHSDVNSVRDAISIVSAKLGEVGSQVGMSGLQVINAVQSGNASLGRQLCESCFQSQLATISQTNALQSQAASNFASLQLEMAKNEASDQLAVCSQTNSILNAINAQTVAMNEQFCALKERELQNKVDTQGDIITQLRNQISNDNQTLAFNKAINALDDKIDAIAAKQPNTVPVVYPNLQAYSTTPNFGGFNPYGYGYNGGSYWG